LATTAVEWGLIGPGEAGRIWERHLANSVALSVLIGQGATVFDIGSGAGLPGIPLALARPDLNIDLVEPLLRRSRFLTETVAELGLESQVRVIRARAEEIKTAADVVVARAVAPLVKLVGWTKHLFPQGQLLALKGERASTEVAEAKAKLTRWGLVAEVLYPGEATVVRVRPMTRE
jgi:16S rRNA (guanine527-N7)-methyltransferase